MNGVQPLHSSRDLSCFDPHPSAQIVSPHRIDLQPAEMSRPSNSTSAYESFPAHEFDAWIDHLRHTIIDGLEEPELELPKLSNGALEAVKQAERQAAEAEARAQEAARAREEEARLAAQRQLEEQRQMLAQLQQKRQQLEEQRQQLAREQERREAEQQRYEEEQYRQEEERRLQETQNGLVTQGGEFDEDAEYERDSEEVGGADHAEQDFVDNRASEDHQDRPYEYDEPIADHEDDLFGDEEDPFDDEQPQFPQSPRSQLAYADQQEASEDDEEEIIEEDEEEMQTMEVDESGRAGSQSQEDEGSLEQSEGDDQDRSPEQSEREEDVRSASEDETAPSQGYGRTYATVQTNGKHISSRFSKTGFDFLRPAERDASESQEGDYEQGEEYDEEDQDQTHSGSDTRQAEYEESEREDAVWEDDQQPRSRQPAQPASYPSLSNQSREEEQDQADSQSDTGQVEYEKSEGDEAGRQEEEQSPLRQLARPASYPSPPTQRGDASDAIEFIDSSDEENESAQPRRNESASQESGEDNEERPRRGLSGDASGDGAVSDAETADERSAHSQEEENSEGDHDDENVEPLHFAGSSTTRPSDYDMDDDGSENGYESDEEGADEESDVQDQADATELNRDAIVMRESSEDELAEDEEDQQANVEMEYAAYSEVERPHRTVQLSSEGDVALDIDPALQYDYTEVEQPQQMVQVSSQSVVVSGLLQMAYGTESRVSAIPEVPTPVVALEREESGDRQILPDATEATLPRDDGSSLPEPENEYLEARMAEEVSGADELEPSATQATAAVDHVIPETTSAPELSRSAIVSDLPAVLPTSTFTENEADDELQQEGGLSAAPSISTFSAIFANTPTRLSPARDAYDEIVALDRGESYSVDAIAMDASRLEEEPRTQDTLDFDVDSGADVLSVRSGAESDDELESDEESAHPTVTAEAHDAAGKGLHMSSKSIAC